MNMSAQRSPVMSLGISITAASVSGLGFGLAQPGLGYGLLGLVFLMPLLGAFRARSWVGRAALGWLAGSVGASVGAGDAAAQALKAYFDLAGPSLIVAWLAASQILGALPGAVFGAFAVDPREVRAPIAFVSIGSAWVLSEMLRDFIFPGAWLSLSNCLTSMPVLLQSASEIGHLGVSFWLAGTGALLYSSWKGPDRRAAAAGLMLLVFTLGAHTAWIRSEKDASGSVSVAIDADPGPQAIRVSLIQSGRDSRQQTAKRSDRESLGVLLQATEAAGTADLVVWPESAFEAIWPFNQGLLTDAFASATSVPFKNLLFGAPWIEAASSETELGAAAVLIDSKFRIRDRHRKTHLLPLAEDQTRHPFFGFGESGAGYGAAANAEPLDIGSARLGVFLCYEVLFADLARNLVSSGADVLVNLSNESWLGPESRGPDQMLAAAVLRAIEVRRPIIRSTTTGITAAIDARGRVIATLEGNESAFLTVDVVPGRANSGFVRFGHLPVAGLVILWAVFWAARLARGNED